MRALRARVRSLLAGGWTDAALRALLATCWSGGGRRGPRCPTAGESRRTRAGARSGTRTRFMASRRGGRDRRRPRRTRPRRSGPPARRRRVRGGPRRAAPAARRRGGGDDVNDRGRRARWLGRRTGTTARRRRRRGPTRSRGPRPWNARSSRPQQGAGGAARALPGRRRGAPGLELEQYAEPFAKAGVDDAALAELAATIDADKSEGADAVDALIARVPVRGGSGVRLRKALLEKDGGRGRGGGAAGRGGRAGRGRGKGKKAPPPPAPKAAKPTKPKKKKDDGAMLAATLAERRRRRRAGANFAASCTPGTSPRLPFGGAGEACDPSFAALTRKA